jgi:hypothetical protein
MTTYISEKDFRNCELNFLSSPSPFVVNGSEMVLNPDYHKDSSIIKILAIDDTFHDLSQDRNGYDNRVFNESGPLNFLLTGNFVQGNFLDTYKSELNYPEFSSAETGKRFEAKVAKSIEINKGLQTADTVITYDEIISGFQINETSNIITIDDNLKQKILLSNGSLKLIINTNNPIIKNMDVKKFSFSNYIIAITNGNENTINKYYFQLSCFVRWYLHSSDLDNFDNLRNPNFTINMPHESMKVLSDAGIGFLGDFLSIPNSNVTPFIAIPCFLDSASTSTEPLDPNIPIFFEEVIPNIVIPVVSNYFSCNEYFICYLLNEGSTFDINNIYNFSLVIFKIQQEVPNLVNAINYVRGSENMDNNYYEACKFIKEYIDTYPQVVARYYFGEVKKQQVNGASDLNDNLECGTCGAGVPYVGKVMNLLIALKNRNQTNVSGAWLSPNIVNFKNFFNTLKTQGSLNSRIPISDSRILKLFCYLNPDGSSFMNMTSDDFYSLFKILADYKRTGDYQQSYTVLKQILKEGNNARCFTFSSGDELSTLIGRLLGVPSIYQIGATGTCSLYRCSLLNASPADRLKLKIKNDANIFKNYTEKINYKFQVTMNFITAYYSKICELRQQILSIIQIIHQKLITNNNGIEIFLLIRLWNAYYILNNILSNCNHLQSNNDAFQGFVANLQEIYQSNNEINTNIEQLNNINDENQLSQFQNYLTEKLIKIADFENTDIFALYNILDNDYPLLTEQSTDYFNPLTEEENNSGTFIRQEIGLNVKNTLDNEKTTKPLIKFILSQREQPPQRESDRNRERRIQKKEFDDGEFVNNFNNFIGSMKINNMYDKPFQISTASEFNPEFINDIVSYANEYTTNNQNDTPCDGNTFNSIQQFLTQILSLFSQQQQQNHRGGRYFNTKYSLDYNNYNQKGGSIQQYNGLCIYNEINQLLLNLMNKCSLYISNVIKNENINQNMNMSQILLTISNLYETDNFCQKILVEQDDSYNLESENIGFVVALELLAQQYCYSDVLENTINTQNGYNFGDDLLSINDMLDILELPYIKLVIYLLSWRNPSALYLSSDLIQFDLTTNYNAIDGQIVCDNNMPNEDTLILCCLASYLNINFNNYYRIFEYLRNPVLFQGSHETFSIFSILSLAYTYYIYYGANSSDAYFYEHVFNDVSTPLLNQIGAPGGLAHMRTPVAQFLQNIFPLTLNSITANLITKLGAPATATGPAASARGLNRASRFTGTYPKSRGGKTRKNSKNKKIKTIKHRKNNKLNKKHKSRRFNKKKDKRTRK